LRGADIAVTAFDARGARDLVRTVRRLVSLIKEHEIHTVFSFLIHANTVAAMASRKVHDVVFFQSIQTVQAKPKWHWWLQAIVQKYASRVVVPSSAVANRARDTCGVASERIVLIPNAVDLSQFTKVAVFQDPKKLRVGFLGRLDPVKGGEFFVQSLWFAGSEQVRVEGHIFGEGPDRPRIEKAIRDFNVGDRVFLRGATPSPQAALREMDVLFFVGGQEGFGLVVIEAMASGVPVITFASGGVKDIVQDGQNGILLKDDMFSYRFLSARLDWLLRHPEERERIIKGGLNTVNEKYSWDVVLPQYRNLLGIDS